MPTPFTHLKAAQDLLADPLVPEQVQELLRSECSAFLLGNIAADARISSGTGRADTHFYRYDQPMADHPWRVMLGRYPSLKQPSGEAQRAFLAGYVAHLSMDEIWTLNMLRPRFVEPRWGDDRFRFFMLHVLLVYVDQRDYAGLETWQGPVLGDARARGWLPFLPDADLHAWRDFIQQQVVGESETLSVLGQRVQRSPAEFEAVLNSPERMQADLWDNVPHVALEQVEQQMYTFARDQMLLYLDEYTPARR